MVSTRRLILSRWRPPEEIMGRRLLVVAFDYPPRKNAGVHRTLRYLRHLREFAWRVDVLTAASSSSSEETDACAETVIRTQYFRLFLPASAAARLLPESRRSRFLNCFALPDLFVGWLPFAAWQASSLLR